MPIEKNACHKTWIRAEHLLSSVRQWTKKSDLFSEEISYSFIMRLNDINNGFKLSSVSINWVVFSYFCFCCGTTFTSLYWPFFVLRTMILSKMCTSMPVCNCSMYLCTQITTVLYDALSSPLDLFGFIFLFSFSWFYVCIRINGSSKWCRLLCW